MEHRNNDSPNYQRNENDDITEDVAHSLPTNEPGSNKDELKDNTTPNKDTKSSEWQRRLREEMSTGREERDFTD